MVDAYSNLAAITGQLPPNALTKSGQRSAPPLVNFINRARPLGLLPLPGELPPVIEVDQMWSTANTNSTLFGG
jgi:hypothetical protein